MRTPKAEWLPPHTRESFAAEVMFNPGLKEPVVIGQDGKKEEGYPKELISKPRTEQKPGMFGDSESLLWLKHI